MHAAVATFAASRPTRTHKSTVQFLAAANNTSRHKPCNRFRNPVFDTHLETDGGIELHHCTKTELGGISQIVPTCTGANTCYMNFSGFMYTGSTCRFYRRSKLETPMCATMISSMSGCSRFMYLRSVECAALFLSK